MKLLKLFVAFLLTLLLFWMTPRFNAQSQDTSYFDAAADRFLVDHNAVSRHTIGSDPEITVWVTTSADTSEFLVLLSSRRQGDITSGSRVMQQVAGSYDLYSSTVPRLDKGESYSYHVEVQSRDGKVIARLPEESGREIRLLFEGTPSLPVWIAQVGLMYLAAMFGFLALFDVASLRLGEVRLRRVSRRVATVAFFLLTGGLAAGALVSESRYGYFWGGWPFGINRSQTIVGILIIFWLLLPVLFRGTIFKFRPEKNIVSPGIAIMLTLVGVLFMIVTYLTGDHFVGIPL